MIRKELKINKLNLEYGKCLENVTLAYHCNSDTVNPEKARRTIWICHALTANSDPSEWWDGIVGPGKLFDTEKDFILCANNLGSCYGSTGPSNYGGDPLDFPEYTVRDIVNGHDTLRKHLGLEKIDILAGGSVGGFQALEWAIAEPEIFGKVILIACNARFSAWASAFNESQRMAIESDPDFRHGGDISSGRKGLEAARSIALLSYRNYEGYRLSQTESDENFQRTSRAQSYQRYQGKKLSSRFDAYTYYGITKMLDTHNAARGRGSMEEALGKISAKTLVIGIDSDILFPVREVREMSAMIPDCRYNEIRSDFRHDGFLIEDRQLTESISKFINEK